MDWIRAHWKGIIAVVSAVLVLVVDDNTAQEVIGALGVLGVILKANDQGAIDRIYHR